MVVSILGIFLFNLAMLSKQAWKFLTEDDLMVTKVFKAKYFSQGEFLESKIGHNRSYA